MLTSASTPPNMMAGARVRASGRERRGASIVPERLWRTCVQVRENIGGANRSSASALAEGRVRARAGWRMGAQERDGVGRTVCPDEEKMLAQDCLAVRMPIARMPVKSE